VRLSLTLPIICRSRPSDYPGATSKLPLEHRAAETWSNFFVDRLNISIQRGRLDSVFDAALGMLGAISGLSLMFYGSWYYRARRDHSGNFVR
jgi:hypothetical protein